MKPTKPTKKPVKFAISDVQRQKPILMSTAMAKATAEGIKTKTRRLTGLDVINKKPNNWSVTPLQSPEKIGIFACHYTTKKGIRKVEYVKSPYGQPGDLLYVRETFAVGLSSGLYYFKANGDKPKGTSKWKPSIHLPKKATRLWLEVISIKLERLQDISEEDSIAEGISCVTKDNKVFKYCVYDKGDYSSTPWADMPLKASEAFFNLWKEIHGVGPLVLNPWVWVVEFKRISPRSNIK